MSCDDDEFEAYRDGRGLVPHHSDPLDGDSDGVPVHVEPETAGRVLARLERENEMQAKAVLLALNVVARPGMLGVRSRRSGNC